jgi:hypothetical protein
MKNGIRYSFEHSDIPKKSSRKVIATLLLSQVFVKSEAILPLMRPKLIVQQQE